MKYRIYYFKGKSDPKKIISFKGPLRYKNIKDGYTTLEKAKENKKNRYKGNSKSREKIRRSKKT